MPPRMVPWLLALSLAAVPAGVQAQMRLVEAGGGLREFGDSVQLSCRGSGFTFKDYYLRWYRQAAGATLEWVATISDDSSYIRYGTAVESRATVSRDNSQAVASLALRALRPQDSARYFCAVQKWGVRAYEKLVFGTGTTLTVLLEKRKDSNPEVIAIKSKHVKDGNNMNAVCLARNFYPKNIDLEASSNDVVYEQNKPIVTSEGTYSTIKVVQVKPETEVICNAKFNGTTFTKNTTLPEKEIEEPVTVNVCNITDTTTKDIETEKVNMLSTAVLGLRVLLAKSIAFNTLMSIKLFLF